MKTLLLIFSLFLLPAADNKNPQEEYIEKYSSLAVSEMKRCGVPASITLAQGLLESGAGRSVLAVKANNHFGIKCHKGWTGETINIDDDRAGECFRVYSSPEQSFEDHSNHLRKSERYSFLFDLDPEDYKSWARGLKKAGYATDPAYPQKLISIISRYDLSRFDRGTVVPASETPKDSVRNEPEPVGVDEILDISFSREFKGQGERYVYCGEGDTYGSIARRYDLADWKILALNGLKKPRELHEGDKVIIGR